MSVRERVGSLESIMKDLAYQSMKTERGLDELRRETSEFKEGMQAFKEEMQTFKEEMQAFKEEMRTFKDEMLISKDQVLSFREETSREWRRYNLELGRQANKFGTFVEDMVLPNFPSVLRRHFGVEELERLLPRARVRRPGTRSDMKEFDLVAWTKDTVFLNETKSRGTAHEFERFLTDLSIFDYFPELEGKRLVRIASALNISREVIDYLSDNICYAMMLADDTMDIVNYGEVARRTGLR